MLDNEIKNKLINSFLRISKIPRESGNEDNIADFFVEVAKENDLYYFRDKNKNVLIKKKGILNSSPIALQAHLDMVCVKTKDSKHNFKTDGIDVSIDGDKVTAKGTSLGADQGVGLAMMLTLLEDKSTDYPDLEFFFTAEEETTFNGVVNFPYEKVESKRLINLDYAKDDAVVIGADGDILNEYSFKGKLIENKLSSYKILIDNFPGGNSGDNIELSKENAITTMAKILKNKDVLLTSINGGSFENDLATYCEVIINTELDVYNLFKDINHKLEKVDNKMTFSSEDTQNIINEILELKCGYLSNNGSSGNLGVIKTKDTEIKIYYIIRSSNEIELDKISRKSKELKNNFLVKEMYRDSIWEVNKDSELLNKYKNLYFNIYNEYPKEEIGHGGCECSSIKKRIAGLDVISIGSVIENYHTTEEVTYISSWINIYKLLVNFLQIKGD